jgi:hypothetical protein
MRVRRQHECKNIDLVKKIYVWCSLNVKKNISVVKKKYIKCPQPLYGIGFVNM